MASRLNIREQGDITILMSPDRKILDNQQIQDMAQEIFDLIEKENRKRILFNFRGVDFMSSLFLQKLIVIDKKLKRSNGRIVFCEMKPEIYEVFVITRLSQLFYISDNEEDGIAALSAAAVA